MTTEEILDLVKSLADAEDEIARLRRIEKAARPAERVLESCRSAGLLNEEETAVLNALYVALRAALEADHLDAKSTPNNAKVSRDAALREIDMLREANAVLYAEVARHLIDVEDLEAELSDAEDEIERLRKITSREGLGLVVEWDEGQVALGYACCACWPEVEKAVRQVVAGPQRRPFLPPV